jgi:hypothetical protein
MYSMNIEPKAFVLDWIGSAAYIPVNKYTAHKIGLNEAIMLAEIINQYKYWASRSGLNEHDEFYWTVEDCREQTTFKADRQKAIFASLEKQQLIKRNKRQIKKGENKTARYIKILFENIPPVLFDDQEAAAKRKKERDERKTKVKGWNERRKLRRKSESGKTAIPTESKESGNSTDSESGKSPVPESGKSPTNKNIGFKKKDLKDNYIYSESDSKQVSKFDSTKAFKEILDSFAKADKHSRGSIE